LGRAIARHRVVRPGATWQPDWQGKANCRRSTNASVRLIEHYERRHGDKRSAPVPYSSHMPGKRGLFA
jgi:hypothetical protein